MVWGASFFSSPNCVNFTVDTELCRCCTNAYTVVLEHCALPLPLPTQGSPRDTLMSPRHASGFKQMHVCYRSFPYGSVSDSRSNRYCLSVCLASLSSEHLNNGFLLYKINYVHVNLSMCMSWRRMVEWSRVLPIFSVGTTIYVVTTVYVVTFMPWPLYSWEWQLLVLSGPRSNLDALEYRKISCPSQNSNPDSWPSNNSTVYKPN
jgi:hypothetical protein